MKTELLTVKELAQFLKVSEMDIYLMVQKRRIPFKRFGKLYRFDKEEILKWIEDCSLEEAEHNLEEARKMAQRKRKYSSKKT